jgi:dihydroorotase
MITGWAYGTIAAIRTDQAPHSIEEKEVEFIYAPNGIPGLETAWSVSVRRLLESGILSLGELLEKFVRKPREILNLEIPRIKEGADANLTLFNIDEQWTYDEKLVKSKSANSPYLGDTMLGRAEAIYNKGNFVVNKI